MKVKIQINLYKQLVSRICSLVNKETANSKEKNIKLEVTDKWIKVTAVQNSVLKGTFSLLITELDQIEPGVVYVNAEAFSKITSSLPNEPYVIISLNRKKELVYKVPSYGSISESIYNDQDPFKGIQFYENRFNLLSSPVDLSEVVTALNKCASSSQAWFVAENNSLQLYGQFAQSGFVKYTIDAELKNEFQVYLNHANLKSVSYLEEIEIHYNIKPKSLKFISEEQEFTLIGKEVCKVPFKAINIVDQVKTKPIAVSLEDLNKAVLWQSYGFQEGDGMTLLSEGDSLIIKGERVEEAASIQLISGSEFGEITLPTEALKSALKTLGKSEHVDLSLVNTSKINILKLAPNKESKFKTVTILYEQCNLNR